MMLAGLMSRWTTPFRMSEGHRLEHAHEELHAALDRVAAVVVRVAGGEPLDHRLQRLAVDVLHHEVVVAGLVHADVVDGDDVGVLEPPDRADLLDEARQRRVGLHVGAQLLQRHPAADVVVLGADHLPEAAPRRACAPARSGACPGPPASVWSPRSPCAGAPSSAPRRCRSSSWKAVRTRRSSSRRTPRARRAASRPRQRRRLITHRLLLFHRHPSSRVAVRCGGARPCPLSAATDANVVGSRSQRRVKMSEDE